MNSLTFLSTATLVVQLLAFGGACHVAIVSKKRGWWLLALGIALITLRRSVDLTAGQGAYAIALHAAIMLTGITSIFKAYQDDIDGLVELANSVPNMVAIMDAKGEPVYLNERWQDFAGIGLEGMRHRAWEQLVHPDDLDGVAKAWDTSLATGDPMEADVRFRCEDGTYRWFLCRAFPIRSKKGAVVRWYASSTDIHERKEGTIWLSKISDEVSSAKATLAKAAKEAFDAACTATVAAETGLQSRAHVAAQGVLDEAVRVAKETEAREQSAHAETHLKEAAQAAALLAAAALRAKTVLDDAIRAADGVRAVASGAADAVKATADLARKTEKA